MEDGQNGQRPNRHRPSPPPGRHRLPIHSPKSRSGRPKPLTSNQKPETRNQQPVPSPYPPTSPQTENKKANTSACCAIDSLSAVPNPCPEFPLVRSSTVCLVPLACKRATILREFSGSTRGSL